MKVELGTVSVPSGKLLLIDPGYLRLWCHDRPPVLPDGFLSGAEATARANTSVDLRIVGRDAEAVGRAFDRQWHPLFLFDVPREAVEKIAKSVADVARPRDLDARVSSIRLIEGGRIRKRTVGRDHFVPAAETKGSARSLSARSGSFARRAAMPGYFAS